MLKEGKAGSTVEQVPSQPDSLLAPNLRMAPSFTGLNLYYLSRTKDCTD